MAEEDNEDFRFMLTRRLLLAGTAAGFATAWLMRLHPARAVSAEHFRITHSDAEWRARLTPDAYAVLRQAGTEAPFSSALLNEHRHGTFACAGCDTAAFAATTKFDSGTGWPSFWAALDKGIATSADTSFAEERTEVHCSQCGGHLGHVFDDGPQPTGLRYCMNGVALHFHPSTL